MPGLHVRPLVLIGDLELLGRPDLVDVELRTVLEADSFAWHGDRTALRRDARRYDQFVVAGWLVLRFAYEDVMSDPRWGRRDPRGCRTPTDTTRSLPSLRRLRLAAWPPL